MADDPLRELLSSPLEASPRRVRAATGTVTPTTVTGASPGGWWLAASVLVGGLLTLGGYLVAADDPAPTTTTLAPTTTTTTAVATGPILPEGYLAVDERIGMRVERVLVRPEEVLVTVSSVVPAGLAPTETSGFPGGRWDLVLADGRRITSTDEGSDGLAQGFVSVRFPVTGLDVGEIVGVELTGLGHRLSQVVSATVDGVVLPPDGAEVEVPLATTEFPLDDGVVLHIDRFAVSTTTGVLDWSLGGDDPDAVGSIAPQLALVADGDTHFSNPRVDTGQFRFFLSFLGLNPLVREGRAYFDPQTPAGFSTTEAGATAALDIEVTWVVFESTRVTFDLEDALISTMEG